jgi:hypothetical protein
MVKPQQVTIAAGSAKAASEKHTERCAAANLAVARLRGPCPFRCLRSDDECPQQLALRYPAPADGDLGLASDIRLASIGANA